MKNAIVIFGGVAWRGAFDAGVLWFDAETREGNAKRCFALPEFSALLLRGPWPEHMASYTDWFVHLADIVQTDAQRGVWKVVDREIDLIVEPDLQTYRMIDLEDFGRAIVQGSISAQDAGRLLESLQRFVDTFLHGGGKFPPESIRKWLDASPKPERVVEGQ